MRRKISGRSLGILVRNTGFASPRLKVPRGFSNPSCSRPFPNPRSSARSSPAMRTGPSFPGLRWSRCSRKIPANFSGWRIGRSTRKTMSRILPHRSKKKRCLLSGMYSSRSSMPSVPKSMMRNLMSSRKPPKGMPPRSLHYSIFSCIFPSSQVSSKQVRNIKNFLR